MPLPNLSFKSSSEALGGTQGGSPWYQGDVVVSYAAEAISGDRTAPAEGSLAGAVGPSLGVPLLLAAAILGGVLLWKKSR